MSKQDKNINKIDRQTAELYRRALEEYLQSREFSKRQVFFTNFMRGVAFSLGSILMATIGILLILKFLSLFGHVPWLAHPIENFKHSLGSYR